MTKIMRMRQDENEEITNVLLDNGRSLTLEQAIQEAKEGKIEGVNVAVSKNGREYLRANPNNNKENNLENLLCFNKTPANACPLVQ